MRPSTVPPGERAVRNVARENVLEEELALAGDSRPELREHELAVLESPERLVRRSVPVLEEPRDRTVPEHPTHDGRGQKCAPLDRRQQVDARGEHRLHGVGDDDLADVLRRPPTAAVANDPALVDEMADDLLEEERVPVGAREDRLSRLVGQVVHGEEHLDEGRRVVVRQRLEEDRTEVALSASPACPALGEVGTRGADEEERAGDAVRELLEQVEQRVVRPVDVLDDDDRRTVRGETGEERPPRLVGLEPHLARRKDGQPESLVLEPEREREDRGRTCGIGNGSEDVLFESGDLGERSLGRIRVEHTRVRLEHLAERPVGDRLAVRQAAALQHRDAVGLRVRPREQLARQATLPDAGVAIDRDQLRPAGRREPSEDRAEELELLVAADHRRAQARDAALGIAGSRARSSRSSTVATGRDFPLTVERPTSRKAKPRAARAVRSATRICPDRRSARASPLRSRRRP